MLRAVVAALSLSACVAAAPVAPVGPATLPVTVDGRALAVTLGAASIGRVPGQDGLGIITGRSASVGGLGQSDGLVAKRAVTLACAEAGGSLNDRALGRFAGGAWVFDGVCA